MSKIEKDIVGTSGAPLVALVSDTNSLGITPPEAQLEESTRSIVKTLSGFQKEALVASSATGQTWRMISDEGAYLNGHDAAPPPLAFLTVGMISSFFNEIEALAMERKIALRRFRLQQDNYYTMQGSMKARTMVAGAEDVELKAEIDSDAADAEINQLLMDAVHASPVGGFIRAEVHSQFKLGKNGQVVSCGRVKEVDRPLLPIPEAYAARTGWSNDSPKLIERLGRSPRKAIAKGTSAKGSSFSQVQDRRLNIAAVAERREDGDLEVTQHLYSPHGTSFRFLSSQHGRAPDANSYVSAGIGFCFMTQLGRFASMEGIDLPGYAIVQDAHFSLGGASGGTGRAGKVAPIETHVYLDTTESDEVAREIIDVAEQTCFLHAFSRTPLRVRLKVQRN